MATGTFKAPPNPFANLLEMLPNIYAQSMLILVQIDSPQAVLWTNS